MGNQGTKKLGETCINPWDCKGYKGFADPGTTCCKGRCTEKVGINFDYVGGYFYYCPHEVYDCSTAGKGKVKYYYNRAVRCEKPDTAKTKYREQRFGDLGECPTNRNLLPRGQTCRDIKNNDKKCNSSLEWSFAGPELPTTLGVCKGVGGGCGYNPDNSFCTPDRNYIKPKEQISEEIPRDSPEYKGDFGFGFY